MCFLEFGEWQPVDSLDVNPVLATAESRPGPLHDAVKLGLGILDSADSQFDPRFCDSRAAVACLSRLEFDRDLCNMISDMLRFLRIGFAMKKASAVDLPPLGDAGGEYG